MLKDAADTGAAAWVAVALLLALPALALSGVFAGPQPESFSLIAQQPLAQSLIWQRELAAARPWLAITSAWLHFSSLHLAANLLGALCVVLLGLAARLPRSAAWAWLAAWPLTQYGLFIDERIQAYGGLSGVLHAGVAVAAVYLLSDAQRASRVVGVLLLAGTALKIAGEAPWDQAVHAAGSLHTPVVPLAHAAGALSGVLCALAALAIRRVRRS